MLIYLFKIQRFSIVDEHEGNIRCHSYELYTSNEPLANSGSQKMVTDLQLSCNCLLEFYCSKIKHDFSKGRQTKINIRYLNREC
jgi:hypothetical protein